MTTKVIYEVYCFVCAKEKIVAEDYQPKMGRYICQGCRFWLREELAVIH